MGNLQSRETGCGSGENGMLFLLYRTWAIVVPEFRTRSARQRSTAAGSASDCGSSQYSFCSCSQCRQDEDMSDCLSDLFDPNYDMAPNSDDTRLIAFAKSKSTQSLWSEDTLSKEKQRPPIYNPEDYALSLKKFGRKPLPGSPGLYSGDSECPLKTLSSASSQPAISQKDYRNPMLTSVGGEMTLRQFGTVSELLTKLRVDLRLAFPSFVQEFIGDPLDGVHLLLELLRAIQLSQAAGNGPPSLSGVPGPQGGPHGRVPPAVQRRALLDELACLQCLLCCCQRYTEAVRRLTGSSAGLYTLAVCIMSNVNKSRIIALELLTKACEPIGKGHNAVSEALSTLRLRFGEPVRFRFLVGMLTSAGGQYELLGSGLKFLNAFVESAENLQRRLYIQAELEQAGFDIAVIKKVVNINVPSSDDILKEMDRWEKACIDVEGLETRIKQSENENICLKDKVALLERKIQILQEEKGVLISLEKCLKDRCCELQDEVTSYKSSNGKNSTRSTKNKIDPSPAEDEGISSSERSLTPEDEVRQDTPTFDMYGKENHSETTKKLSDDEEETTIEEVIEELRNIINDAETEQFASEKRAEEERQRAQEVNNSRIIMKIDSNVAMEDTESEIVPCNLQPQPPRRTRSLVHLYIPTEDYEYHEKELFFEDETPFTSDESSDSLLSASKNLVAHESPIVQNDNREILNTIMDAREKAIRHEKRHYQKPVEVVKPLKRSESCQYMNPNEQLMQLQKEKVKSMKHSSFDGMFFVNSVLHTPASTPVLRHSKSKCKSKESKQKLKSKSLDRIDDGLDSMVDIVVTSDNHVNIEQRLHTKSDSGNHTETTVSRSTSNICQRKDPKLSQPKYEDKHRMFLPVHRFDNREVPESRFYFPRIPETSSFLIKRGHTNAGLYSGHHHQKDVPLRSPGRPVSSSNSNRTSGSNRKSIVSIGKLTDLPSGLY